MQHFNSRGNELTYDSGGTIYIDTVAIPNSDIFVYFPYLFKAKRRKDLNGFDDFVQNIHNMGLSDLIFQKQTNYQLKNLPQNASASEENWWFLD